MSRKFFVSDFDEIQNMSSQQPKDFTYKIWISYFEFHQNQRQKLAFMQKGPPLDFQENRKITISSTDVGEKYFFDPAFASQSLFDSAL